MTWLILALAAVAGFAVCAAAVTQQHWLYRQPEYRSEPLSGRRRRAYMAGAGISGAMAWGLAVRAGDGDAAGTAVLMLFSTILVVLASTDFERRLLPNRLMYPAFVLAALLCWAWPGHSLTAAWVGAGVAAGAAVLLLVVGLVFGVLLRVRVMPFGIGDAKLIVLIGLIVGWPNMMTALFVGMVAAGIPSIVMIARGQRKSVFSYGPYLAAGALAVMLLA